MEKITLELNAKKAIKKKFGTQEITMFPYIGVEEMVEFTQTIINRQMKIKSDSTIDTDDYTFTAEDVYIIYGMLDLYIVEHCTNIDVESLNTDNLISSGFSEFISKHIINYKLVKKMLELEIIKYNNECLFINFANTHSDITDTQELLGDMTEQLKNIDPKVLETLIKNNTVETIKENSKKETKQKVKENLKDHKEKLS